MRTLGWDSGVTWGDPNARWGSPSYLLEPGDPGYVADPRSASFPAHQITNKRSKMPKEAVIKKGERDFSQQLIQFCSVIDVHGATVGVTAGQITAVKADS